MDRSIESHPQFRTSDREGLAAIAALDAADGQLGAGRRVPDIAKQADRAGPRVAGRRRGATAWGDSSRSVIAGGRR